MRKIALEEHFMAPGFEQYEQAVGANMAPHVYDEFTKRLIDFDKQRIEIMDQCEIAVCVLSQTTPGLQEEHNTEVGISKAIEVNNFLASKIENSSGRFRGFAHLSMHDAAAAAKELKRCVEQLGFVGALINGHTNGIYLDNPIYWQFWECVEELRVPVYLHPTNPYDMPRMLDGHQDLLGPMWAWTVETSTHALRLVTSGLFDRYPSVKIILGHMGETLPFVLWRLDSRWEIGVHQTELKQKPSHYIKNNFVITTSGVCENAALQCSIATLGIENVLFSVDYPFESSTVAADFIEEAPLTAQQRELICWGNASRILRI